ncbi:MAG: flagellar export chaperone FliS, partial [Planctomycetota bacterium]
PITVNSPHVPRSASSYFETQVRTASQPQLQLILLDGALRSTRQATRLIRESNDWQAAGLQIAKAAEIAEGLVKSVADGKSDLSHRLEEEYAFLYRELTAARINRDLARLDHAADLLEYERETWRLACERVAADAAAVAPAPMPKVEPQHRPSPHIALGLDSSATLLSGGGLSLEA